MVRLEWAHIEAFDSAAEKALGPEDLIELGPDLRAGLQPYIRLLEFEYPVDKLLIQVNRASEEHEEASNAVLKQKHHGLARRAIQLKRERNHLAVHRMDFTVYYRRIAAEEFRILNALREGQPVGHAIQYGFENSTASLDEQRRHAGDMVCCVGRVGLVVPASESQEREGNHMIEYFEKYYRLLNRASSSLASPFLLAVRLYWGWQFIANRLGKAD